jgi:uncharacterized protein (DUF885 family)
MRRTTRIAPWLTLFITASALAQNPSKELHEIFDRYDRWYLQEHPTEAMARGDYSKADRLDDVSLAAIESRQAARQDFLTDLEAIDPSQLSEEDLVSYELFKLAMEQAVEGYRFRTFLAPIGGRFGPQQRIPQMADRVRFRYLRDYENYLARLEQVPQMVDDIIVRMKLGVAEGRTPPMVTLRGVPSQFEALRTGDGLNALAEPFQDMPDHIEPSEQERLQRRFVETSMPAVAGALAKLETYFVEDYLPVSRQSIAAVDMPDGEAFYDYQLRVMTTTELTPQEIHEIGLAEVKRIRAEMMEVIRSSDFMQIYPEAASLDDEALFKAFIQYLRSNSRFYHETPEALLAQYRDICKQVDGWMPKFFKTLPRQPYGVRPIPDFMAPSQTTAYYSGGDLRNAEAGYFYANTYALDQRPKYEMVALALHEAVPGHHHQVAVAKELQNVPAFRTELWFTAFGEGWALYSERLGIEMGLYDDPYSDFGRLLYEMWRATRLVVDPGMHALGWSRPQAIQFMLENTALSRLNIETEIDRYIAWPGQATGYKIGELEIRALRAQAEAALGQRFDLREFHDVVLTAGSIPLPVLKRRVNDWIEKATAMPQPYD